MRGERLLYTGCETKQREGQSPGREGISDRPYTGAPLSPYTEPYTRDSSSDRGAGDNGHTVLHLLTHQYRRTVNIIDNLQRPGVISPIHLPHLVANLIPTLHNGYSAILCTPLEYPNSLISLQRGLPCNRPGGGAFLSKLLGPRLRSLCIPRSSSIRVRFPFPTFCELSLYCLEYSPQVQKEGYWIRSFANGLFVGGVL